MELIDIMQTQVQYSKPYYNITTFSTCSFNLRVRKLGICMMQFEDEGDNKWQ